MGFSLPQIEFFHNNLISLYETMGHISVARKVFDKMPHRNVVSYNAMIGAYSRNKEDKEAYKLFADMRNHGFFPTQFTYGSLFSCDSLNTDQGFCLQAVAMKSGLLFADAFVGTALLGLFGRQGYIREAFMVFEEMPFKNLVTWNAIISLCGHQGYADECMLMFSHLMRSEITLSESSFVGVLTGFQSKENLESGEQIHALVIKYGLGSSVAIANSLVKMYGKCEGNTFLAEKMFQMASNKDLMTWNTIIGILAKGEEAIKAIEFFSKMCINGFLPNKITFLNAITSCSRLDNLTYGELIHAMIIKNQFEQDSLVATSLVNLYTKHDRLEYAHRCFDKIHDKNLVSWNVLIHGYSDKQCSSSLLLLIKMIHSGISPNEFSFSSVIKSLLATELKEIHSLVIKTGFHSNEYVTSSLMTSYAKNGFPSDALRFFQDSKIPLSVVHTNVICGMYNRRGEYHKTQELFCEVENPDIVSWNILIEACSRNGDYKEAFELFHHMLIDRIRPDNYTYVSLITISTNLCNLLLGSSLHGLMIKSDFNHFDIMVNNLMINMYGKCGSIRGSVMIFEEMMKKNVISWTVLISALGLHGFGEEAIEKFKEMEMFGGIKPDKIAFMAALSGCRHVGLVKEGMELFEIMKEKYGIEPEMEHYLVVVDLMARYGDLKEAEKLILGMPFSPNACIWRSFLHGCNRAKSLSSQIQAC